MAFASGSSRATPGGLARSVIVGTQPRTGRVAAAPTPDGGSTFSTGEQAWIVSAAGTTATLTGLTPGSSYQVRVRAVDAAGNASAWSDEITVTAQSDPAPITVAAVAAFPTATAIVPGAVPATIAAAATFPAVAAGVVRTFTAAGTTATATGLTASRNYTATVRARDAAGNWSAWSAPVPFTTTGGGVAGPSTISGVAAFPSASIGGTPPTVTAGRARPVVSLGAVVLDVTATPPGGTTIIGYSWTILSGGGSLTNATTATPTYTAPAGSGTASIQAAVMTANAGRATATVTVAYAPTVVAAENALTGTARASWDLASPNLGGISTLQGFVDGFSVDKSGTVNFKIAQSDAAGWAAEVYRLGWYGGDGARSYGTLTPSGGQVTASQAQASPADADPGTTLISADCAGWSTTLTWTPPAWAPSGIYVLRLNRTGGGASHVMFVLRDDARAAELMLMPSDSTWNAYNAWGGMGGSMYSGNSLYYGTAVDQYNGDCARFVSYNRPVVNRGAADSGRTYGAVEWSTFFTGEYPMVRFLERNGYDVKYYSCLDAAGDPLGTHLTGEAGSGRAGAGAAMFVGHNEYWSDSMRSGWERAKNRGVSVFSCAGNEVFWRTYGTNPDGDGRPRTFECQKSTIGGRGNTRPQWTGTWRDPDGAGKGGDSPENTLTGTIFAVNGPDLRALVVPFAGGYSAEPIWRHTSVASLTTGQTWTSPSQILGFEWDVPGPAFVSTTAASYMAAPHARVRYCSTVTYSVSSGLLLTDAGDVYDASGTATHRLVVHPGGAGAIAFGTGTINWALGLDDANTYQQGSDNTSDVIRQATVNVLMDMGAGPATLMSGLTTPTPVDWYPDVPVTTIAAVAAFPAVGLGSGALPAPATLAAVAAVPAVTIRRTALATPATVAGVAAFPAVTFRSAATVTPATVAAVASIPAVSVQTASGSTAAPGTLTGVAALAGTAVTGSTLAPATIVGVAALPVPTVTTATGAAPATIVATASIGAPTARAGSSPAPATVAGVASLPAPTVQAGSGAAPAPATISASAAVPAPSIQTTSGSVATPATLAVSAAMAAAIALASMRVGAVTLAGSAAFPAPAVRLGVLPTPSTLATSAAFGSVSLRLTATVLAGTVTGFVTIGQISHIVGDVESGALTAGVTGDEVAARALSDSIGARVT